MRRSWWRKGHNSEERKRCLDISTTRFAIEEVADSDTKYKPGQYAFYHQQCYDDRCVHVRCGKISEVVIYTKITTNGTETHTIYGLVGKDRGFKESELYADENELTQKA